MPEERSDKSAFKSLYGGGWISPNQFLAESMCARIARKDKQILPAKFWEIEKWSKFFKFQITLASRLLKKYPYQVIIRALKTKQGSTIYSFGAKWLKPILEKENDLYKKEIEKLQNSISPAVSTHEEPLRPEVVSNKSILAKLKGLSE